MADLLHARDHKNMAARLAVFGFAAVAAAAAFMGGAPGSRTEAIAQVEPGAEDAAARRPTPASRALVGRWTGYTHWGQRYDTYWDINADGTISFGTSPSADGYHGTWEASGSRFTAHIEGSTYRGTISGDVISGPAERGGTRGSFRITRAGGAVATSDWVLGAWRFRKTYRGGAQYEGEIQFSRISGGQIEAMIVTRMLGSNAQATQRATVTVSGNSVTVDGYEILSSSVPWSPDNFFLTRSGDRMTGATTDDAGRSGATIEVFR